MTLLALPTIGAGFVVSVDCLSAIFLAITGTIGFLTTLYSVEYMTRYRNDSVAKYYPLLQLLFAGIVGVVATGDFVFFLVFWELMTFASFFLVTFEREVRASQRAGFKYFVVNQAATFGMIAAALILWTKSGSFHFSAMRDALGGLLTTQPALAHLVLFLFFMGFATKAGILPMGDWLPDAYPAAPSGATAAFGGTMTKLGVYGLLRVFLCFLPLSPVTRTWGLLIALAGAVSLFVGTLTALKQDDIKRLMSFHVIGQVGYMFLGIGLGLFFLPSSPTLAALGLLAGTFHMINHSLYKSCLFLGAGAVTFRTGTRSLSALGGLRAFMPATAMYALIAALAIAGVPPLNGFASKWLMYATAILGGGAFPLFAAPRYRRDVHLAGHARVVPQVPGERIPGSALAAHRSSRGAGRHVRSPGVPGACLRRVRPRARLAARLRASGACGAAVSGNLAEPGGAARDRARSPGGLGSDPRGVLGAATDRGRPRAARFRRVLHPARRGRPRPRRPRLDVRRGGGG